MKPKNTKEILQDFLNLEMLYMNDHIYSLARVHAQKNLDVPTFRNIEINYPKSLQEQQYLPRYSITLFPLRKLRQLIYFYIFEKAPREVGFSAKSAWQYGG